MVFDAAQTEEKPKYLWDVVEAPSAAGNGSDLYVAAGAPAVVYRVPAGGGKAEVAFKTVDQHIRCLLMAADGTLWAGSDGSGVIYGSRLRRRDQWASRLRCMRHRRRRSLRWRWTAREIYMLREWGRCLRRGTSRDCRRCR